MERGPLALFGALVAVGLGPAMWLGAQFGESTVTPERPPAVTVKQNEVLSPQGGTGAGDDVPADPLPVLGTTTAPDPVPQRARPERSRPAATSPAPGPSTSETTAAPTSPSSSPAPEETEEPSFPPTESTTEPAPDPTDDSPSVEPGPSDPTVTDPAVIAGSEL
ncbi:hypothetical protein [Actinoplanes sp. RD1]|uniref:hypothetical protein n=1 Tax=Actinoplanes sp. RD1 TaxID=3064538 RepID=UPI002741FF86|nr:hypothetical protein [Actinoplanes sp. RD1]